MKKITFSQRLRYKVDNMMASGTGAVILWLGIISLLLVIIAGAVLSLSGITQTDSEELSFFEGFWQSLMRTLDAGTMGGDEGWGFRIVMLIVTIGGVFIVSALIGIISAGFDQKLEEMRKGRSFVIESNHTLILGWSSKIYTIISELAEANSNQRKACVVVLSEVEKTEMEEQIRSHVSDYKTTKVVCRKGNPLDTSDLAIVNVEAAKSIIILPPEDEEMADIFVIKCILAIVNNPDRKESKYHIVSEVRDARNLEVIKMIGKDEVEAMLLDEIISRITVQTVHQPGLSVVYESLLRFEGDEIYFANEPKLSGKKFIETLNCYEDSTIIGLRLANGECRLNPEMDYVLAADDEIIAISEDDDTIVMNGKNGTIDDACIIDKDAIIEAKSMHTLILGYNNKTANTLQELGNYLPANSEIDLIIPQKTETSKHIEKKCPLKLRVTHGEIISREFLNEIDYSKYHFLILLAEQTENVQKADANTLVTLLHIRDILEQRDLHINIVSEMLDARNMELARISKQNDFIVSEKLISLLLSMISENKDLRPVLEDLFDADGSEMYFKPITNYVKTGVGVDFYTVTKAAALKNQIAVGYRQIAYANSASKNYGIVLNPKKSEKVIFTADDILITIAED